MGGEHQGMYRSKFAHKIAAPQSLLLPSHRYLIALMSPLQLYGYAAGSHRADTLDSNFFPERRFLLLLACKDEETGRLYMKKISNCRKATMDDIYYVSAADVADKIIDRMRRGLDPLLFADSSLALFSLAPKLRAHTRPKSD
jgi:hypothetical protein